MPIQPPSLPDCRCPRALALVGAAALLAAGCGDRPRAEPSPPPTEDAARPVPIVEVDGRSIAPGPLAGEVELLSLRGLPPIEEWARIVVHGADGRRFAGSRPMALTGARTMLLIETARGFDFQVVEASADGSRFARHEMPDAVRVEVQTLTYTPPPRPDTSLALIATGERIAITRDQLDGLPRTVEPGQAEPRDIWALRDIVGVERLSRAHSLIVRNRNGDELVIPLAEPTTTERLDVLKRNRRGKLHYRQWTLGPQPARVAELRDVIELELRTQQ